MTVLFSEENQPQITTYHFFPSHAPGFGKKGQADSPSFHYSLSHLGLGHFRRYSYRSMLLFSNFVLFAQGKLVEEEVKHRHPVHIHRRVHTLLGVGSGFGVRGTENVFVSILWYPKVLRLEDKHRTPETLMRKHAQLSFPIFTQSIQFFIAYYYLN